MEHRFDELARALAGGLSRREALRRLGGGMAAALLASLGAGKAWGQSPRDCQGYCRANLDPRQSSGAFGACVASCEDCVRGGGQVCGTTAPGAVRCCGDGLTCCGTGCCPEGQACCNGSCCGEGERCLDGQCCPASRICDGHCVDTDNSDNHCGGCGNACTGGEICEAGSCGCPSHLTDCGDGHCVNTLGDNSHCGVCGNACTDGKRCQAGTCICIDTFHTDCGDGVCVNTDNNKSHCGGCGNACTGGEICDHGSCGCPPSLTKCGDGVCVDTSFDVNHCGQCGHVCESAICESTDMRGILRGCVLEDCRYDPEPCRSGHVCVGNGECVPAED